MKNAFLLCMLTFLSATTVLGFNTNPPNITGPSSVIQLGVEQTFVLSDPEIPSGYAIQKIEWIKKESNLNEIVLFTKNCPTNSIDTFKYTEQANVCRFEIKVKVTYWQGNSCSSPSSIIIKFSNVIEVNTNCLGQIEVKANGSTISGNTYTLPEGCIAPITFTSTANNSTGFSWTGPSTWTPSTATGDTYTVTPSSVSGGSVVITAQGPCCNIQGTRTITVSRTRPGTSFVNPVTELCTPTKKITFNLANTLTSLCGASSFTYTLSGNPPFASFSANGLRVITTSASTILVDFAAGNYTQNLNVKVNYPGGSSATHSITITLYNGIPETPTSMQAERVGTSCYYDARTPKSNTASRYFWKVNNGTWNQGVNLSIYAYAAELLLGPSTEVVRVYANSPCGSSGVYTKNLYIPAPPPNCMLMPGTDTDPELELTEAEIRSNDAEESTEAFEFRIFPVPATDFLYIESQASAEQVLQVVNMEGKVVMDGIQIQPGLNEIQLKLPAGMYVLHMTGTVKPYQTKIYVR
ncbi:MAG TPA: T9SS type A sorting domain-containing protein [Saprospiraceae bacterium]|nr:T9SS type A sorting domain-containing protein [Saprospiraceae bacterium]